MAEFHSIPKNPRFQDRTGKVFGNQTVLGFSGFRGKEPMWLCRCKCGNIHIVHGTNLTKPGLCRCMMCRRSDPHHMTPAYRSWIAMKRRCNDPKCDGYNRYGGRGIRICQRWQDSFDNFLHDMGERPTLKHSLHRKNNNGDYEPSNCAWAEQHEQCRHTSYNVMIAFRGQTLCTMDWAKITGLSHNTITKRLHRGWSAERALTTKPIRIKGILQSYTP